MCVLLRHCGCVGAGGKKHLQDLIGLNNNVHVDIACRLENPNVMLWFPGLFTSFTPKYRLRPYVRGLLAVYLAYVFVQVYDNQN